MKRLACHLPVIRTLTLAALLDVGAARPDLYAQTVYTWDGGGGSANANVDNPANWQGDTAPPEDGSASVLFSDAAFGANTPSLNVNLDVNFLVNALTFAGNSSFTLGTTNTRGLDIGAGGLTQNSTAAQTINVPTFLTADQTWSFAAGAGALNFTGTSASGQIINQGHALTLNAAGNNTLNGAISGTGALYKNGAGTMTLAGNNTYTGGTQVNAGTLAITGSVASGNQSNLIVGLSNPTPATLTLSGDDSVSVGAIQIGANGMGSIVQSGGSLILPTTTTPTLSVAQGALNMGYYGISSSYLLSGGTVTTARTQVGDYSNDQSVFVQSGGTHTTGTLSLSGTGTSLGTYNLDGGTLNVRKLTAGALPYRSAGGGDGGGGYSGPGTATFNFNGGRLQAGASDNPQATSNPTTFLTGLSAANVRNGGAIIDTDGFNVTVAQGLVHSTLGVLGNTLTIGNGGSGYTSAPTVTVSGGGGYGATAVAATNAQGQVTGVTLTNAGTNYTSTPTFTFSGGGGSGATATATFTADNALDGGLTKLGDGTLTLASNNTYTGATTISAGTLQVGTGGTAGSLGTNTGTITDNGTLAFNRSDDITVANTISGTGGLTQLGAGTLTLTGASTYTGATTISAGTLTLTGSVASVNENSDINLAVLTVDGSGATAATLNLSGTNGSLSTGATVVGSSGSGTFNQSGGSFTTNGRTFTVGLTASGNGTYNLSGGSLSTGPASVGYNGTGTFNQSGGTVRVADGNVLSLGVFASGSGTYNLDGGTLTTGAVQGGAGTSTFNFNGGTLQASQSDNPGSTTDASTFMAKLTTANVRNGGAIIDTNGFNVTVAPALLHSGINGDNALDGGLTKLGAGTLTLTGTNTYTGGTSVQAGRLVELNNGNALPTGTVNVASGATLELSNTTGSLVSQAANTFTGAGTVQKTGSGTLSFGGNGGTVSVALAAGGSIDVQAGTLKGSSSFQADYTSNQGGLNIAAGATFDGVEGTIRVGQLTGAGTLAGGYNYGTAGSTTIGVNNASGTFTGVIQDSSIQGGTLNLTKAGTGTQTLTGASTYTGGTTINAGTLVAANTSGSATGSGAVQVNSTGTLAGSGALSGPVSVASGGTLMPGSSLAPARLTLANNLALNAGSTLAINLGGTAAGTCGQIQFSGTLTLGGNLSVTTLTGFSLAVGQTFVILDNASNTALVNGTFANAPGGLYTDAAGDTFLVNYQANADSGLVPNDVTLTVVPEPSAWTAVVIGMGLLGLSLHRRASHGT